MAPEPKSSFVVRLSPTLHRGLKAWAEESGMSLNTLAVAILQWASDNGHPGEPQFMTFGPTEDMPEVTAVKLQHEPEAGVAWVGRLNQSICDEETGEQIEIDPGECYFVIDDRAESRVRTPQNFGGKR